MRVRDRTLRRQECLASMASTKEKHNSDAKKQLISRDSNFVVCFFFFFSDTAVCEWSGWNRSVFNHWLGICNFHSKLWIYKHPRRWPLYWETRFTQLVNGAAWQLGVYYRNNKMITLNKEQVLWDCAECGTWHSRRQWERMSWFWPVFYLLH